MWFRPIVTKETIERLFIEIFHLPKAIKFSYLNVENNPLNLPTDTYVHYPSLVYTYGFAKTVPNGTRIEIQIIA